MSDPRRKANLMLLAGILFIIAGIAMLVGRNGALAAVNCAVGSVFCASSARLRRRAAEQQTRDGSGGPKSP